LCNNRFITLKGRKEKNIHNRIYIAPKYLIYFQIFCTLNISFLSLFLCFPLPLFSLSLFSFFITSPCRYFPPFFTHHSLTLSLAQTSPSFLLPLFSQIILTGITTRATHLRTPVALSQWGH